MSTTFFTRVLHEVFADSQIPHDVTPQKLIESFLQKKLAKIPNQWHSTAVVLLTRITQLMYEQNAISVSVMDVFNSFHQDIQNTLNGLVDHYILIREGLRLSFYFDRIRGYYFAFEVRKWQNMSNQQFKQDVDSASDNLVVQNALLWYAAIASKEQMQILDQQVEIKAMQYALRYEYYLNEYFPEIKDLFEPHTRGTIGLLIFNNADGGRLIACSFIPLEDSNLRIRKYQVTYPADSNTISIIAKSLGGESIYFRMLEFVTYNDIDRKAKELIFERLNQLIKKRSLLRTDRMASLPLPMDSLEHTSSGEISPRGDIISTIRNYIERFFESYIAEYRTLIENNFPRLKQYFPWYNDSPLHIVIEFNLRQEALGGGNVIYAVFRNANGQADEIELYEREQETRFTIPKEGDFCVSTKYGEKGTKKIYSTLLSAMFERDALQEWCYDRVKDELKDVLPRIR